MPESKPITELSVMELKALAYDEISKMESIQINLRALNAEISKRQLTEVKPECSGV